jgi:hypothetical protein
MDKIGIITEEKFEKMMNGEKVYIGRKPLQHGKNIFTGDLVNISHGQIIEINGIKKTYFFQLDTNISFRSIIKTVFSSNLNEMFGVSSLFLLKIPNNEVFLSKIESIIG